MANLYTDVAQSFVNKERLRQMNYRGSVLCTSATVAAAAGDTIYICPIPYKSMIKSIRICGNAAIAVNTPISIYGIKSDGVTIENNIGNLTTTPVAVDADIVVDVATSKVLSNTVYQQLCIDRDPPREIFVPTDAFAPYAESRLGMLGITVANAGTYTFIVEYVEHAPSAGPFDKTVGISRK